MSLAGDRPILAEEFDRLGGGLISIFGALEVWKVGVASSQGISQVSKRVHLKNQLRNPVFTEIPGFWAIGEYPDRKEG